MSIPSLLVLAALAASVVTLAISAQRVVPVVALAAPGLEALRRFGIVHLDVAHLPLGVILGTIVAVSGGVIWVRAGGKTLVSAATVVTVVGVVQLLAAFIPPAR
jgi:hypothetical protein